MMNSATFIHLVYRKIKESQIESDALSRLHQQFNRCMLVCARTSLRGKKHSNIYKWRHTFQTLQEHRPQLSFLQCASPRYRTSRRGQKDCHAVWCWDPCINDARPANDVGVALISINFYAQNACATHDKSSPERQHISRWQQARDTRFWMIF